MGYYMGDYYSMSGGTSFYRGDPFWGFLGRLAGTAFKAVTGLGGHSAAPAAAAAGMGRAETIGRGVGSAVGKMRGVISRHPVLSAAGAAAVLGATAGAGVEHMGMGARGAGGHCFHTSRTGKHIRVSCTTGKAIRRMRVTNPKALRRAIRRAHGFARMARKCIAFTSPHRPKGRMYFKARKRK